MASEEFLTRIAEALERLSPPPPQDARPDAPARRWEAGALVEISGFDPIPLRYLVGIDSQKIAVLENSRRLAGGYAAHDVLLWGARGAGKSALVKSTVAELQKAGEALWLVEFPASALDALGQLFDRLAATPQPTIVFIDDLGFDDDRNAARHLRSVLEGGVMACPGHVRLYVTSNRRHILQRDIEEQESAINPRDVVDDKLALADRFGLSLGFHVCTQDQYLAMVQGYAKGFGLAFDPDDALLWSTQRGARSGRIAWHYLVDLAGRSGKSV